MPTYHQEFTIIEHGHGQQIVRFVVSDSYDGLLVPGTPVQVFSIEPTKHDESGAPGVSVDDALSFGLHETRAVTDDDHDAIAFVLAARDVAQGRFCAVIIDPSNPAEAEETDFRGRIGADIQGDDQRWRGGAWSDAPNPIVDWRGSTGSMAIGDILGADLEKLVKSIVEDDPDWVSDNAQDRLGYFYREAGPDPFGHREARFADLVAWEVLIQRIIDEATPDGVTITWVSEESDLYAYPVRWQPRIYTVLGISVPTRYCNRKDSSGENWEPFKVIPLDYYRVRAGGTTTHGSLYVSWRLLRPRTEEQAVSWLRYKSPGDLMAAVAGSLGMTLDISYLTANSIEIRFRAGSEAPTTELTLRDASAAKRAFRSLVAEGRKPQRFYGAATALVREVLEKPRRDEELIGTQYEWDGAFLVSVPRFALPKQDDTRGEMTALTVGAHWCQLVGVGHDGPHDAGDTNVSYSIMPHNAVFWNETGRIGEGDAAYDLSALHANMYILCPGGSDEDHGTVGIEGRDVVLPVAMLRTQHTDTAGTGLWYGVGRFLNWLYRRAEEENYEGELEITLPYMNGFRTGPSDPGSWRNARNGASVPLDGVEWRLVGVERAWTKVETAIRLHRASRYAFGVPTEPPGEIPLVRSGVPVVDRPAALDRAMVIRTYTYGEQIRQGDALAETSPGTVVRGTATRPHYGRIVGVATADGLTGAVARVVARGIVTVPGAAFTPGQPVYLRTAATITVGNITQTPLLAPTGTEDTWQLVGTAIAADRIDFNVGFHFVFDPPIA